MDHIREKRIIRETGLDARVAETVEPVLEALGFCLVWVQLMGLNGLTLRIMAERSDGTMTLEDCELVSRALSPVLDGADLIDRQYHLEISSPGIDRPLVRQSDFLNWCGHVIRVETSLLQEGQKRFRGRLSRVDEESLTIENSDQDSHDDKSFISIPFTLISSAQLVFTVDLTRAALRKDKALRKGRIVNDNGRLIENEE